MVAWADFIGDGTVLATVKSPDAVDVAVAPQPLELYSTIGAKSR